MAKLRIARDVLARTKERSVLTDEEKAAVDQLIAQGDGKGPASASVAELPAAFLRALLDDTRLSSNQRALVSMHLHGMTGRSDLDGIYETQVGSPVEFGSAFAMLEGKSPNTELFLNGRWYPAAFSIQFVPKKDHVSEAVLLQANLSVCEMVHGVSYWVAPALFLDDTGQPCERTVVEVLQHFGLRRLQTLASEFNLKLLRAERAAHESGRVVLVSGPVLTPSTYFWWSRFQPRALGAPESPRRAVVEPELEVIEENRSYHAPYGRQEGVSRLPFLRVFSLDLKCYAYADADDVTPYEFDAAAMGRLHLPPDMLEVLTRVFQARQEDLFGDLVRGKHGGVVVLACGNPGVGKTLTAEVYAEHTERPLYVLELGELGTNVVQVEENLQRVFARVARWNAVLQFDECEIFLAQRGEDLERSAIVGSFLRLLDYYQGILFLTTNRWDVLDHAVLSRVMLKLHYPDLDLAARAAVWRTMLNAAGLSLVSGAIEELAEAQVNGRQIRNLTRLAKIIYPGGQVMLPQMQAVLSYGCS